MEEKHAPTPEDHEHAHGGVAEHEHHPTGECCTLWDRIPSKMAFWAGVVTSAAILSLAGLIVLIIFFFRGGELSKLATTKTSGTATATTTTNTNAAIDPLAKYVYYPTGTVQLSEQRHVLGTGDFMLVEFSDFECPFCKRFSPVMKQLLEKYDGKLRWSYRHFDTGLHDTMVKAAMGSECAADQGKFWEFHDKVFELSGSNAQIEDATLTSAADGAGLNRSDFDSCLGTEKYKDRVTADTTEAKRIGASVARLGTPFPVLVDKTGKVILSFQGALQFADAMTVLDNYIK